MNPLSEFREGKKHHLCLHMRRSEAKGEEVAWFKVIQLFWNKTKARTMILGTSILFCHVTQSEFAYQSLELASIIVKM